jgi:hypothetical protein
MMKTVNGSTTPILICMIGLCFGLLMAGALKLTVFCAE